MQKINNNPRHGNCLINAYNFLTSCTGCCKKKKPHNPSENALELFDPGLKSQNPPARRRHVVSQDSSPTGEVPKFNQIDYLTADKDIFTYIINTQNTLTLKNLRLVCNLASALVLQAWHARGWNITVKLSHLTSEPQIDIKSVYKIFDFITAYPFFPVKLHLQDADIYNFKKIVKGNNFTAQFIQKTQMIHQIAVSIYSSQASSVNSILDGIKKNMEIFNNLKCLKSARLHLLKIPEFIEEIVDSPHLWVEESSYGTVYKNIDISELKKLKSITLHEVSSLKISAKNENLESIKFIKPFAYPPTDNDIEIDTKVLPKLKSLTVCGEERFSDNKGALIHIPKYSDNETD